MAALGTQCPRGAAARLGLGALTVLVIATLGAEARTASWPSNVTELKPTADATVSARGDLAKGATMALAWAAASNVACFPATEFVNFQGNHVLYAAALPAHSELTIRLIPANKAVDVNLYALQIGGANVSVPPGISSATTCNASYDQVHDSNPGATETVKLNSTTNPYNVVIGVAGPKGVTAGSYKLELELKTAATVQSATLGATEIASKAAGTVEVSGDLTKGGVIDLAWAAKSNMACFPATENVNFNGNHAVYRTSIPKQTIMTVTATPDDAKTDLSVYAYEVAATDTTSIPPNVASAVSCEAGYDAAHDNNPGKAETVSLTAITNPYNVFIGVAGANGAKTGKFKLKVTLKPRP